MLYKSLKDIHFKYTPTCFGSHRIHHQWVITYTWLKLRIMVQLCLLCAWSVFGGMFWTCSVCVRNFSQVHVIIPWWWILCDPKHAGVYFNLCLFDFYIT